MNGRLAHLGLKYKALDTHVVADVEQLLEDRVIHRLVLAGADVVALYVDLHSTRAILYICERRLTHHPLEHDSTRQGDLLKVALLLIEVDKDIGHLCIDVKVLGGVRIDTGLAHAAQVVAALFFLFGQLSRGRTRGVHGRM